MSQNEIELISVIQASGDPVDAIFTAIEVFTSFLKQCEEDQSPEAVCLPESAETAVA